MCLVRYLCTGFATIASAPCEFVRMVPSCRNFICPFATLEVSEQTTYSASVDDSITFLILKDFHDIAAPHI